MAIKDTRNTSQTLQQKNHKEFDDLVNDLIVEFTVGGDRFDVDDIDFQICSYGFDREALYSRLKEKAAKLNADSVGKGLGEILPKDFFIRMTDYWLFSVLDNRYVPVQRLEDGKWNVRSKDSQELLSPDMWFDSVSGIDKGMFLVTTEGGFESNFLLSNGKLMSPEWFDRCMNFYGGYAVVERNGREWFVDRTNESLTGNVTFKECRSFHNGVGIVTYDNDEKHIINFNGELSSRSFKLVYSFRGESAIAVENDDKLYQIDKAGRRLNDIRLDVWFVTALPTVHEVGRQFGKEMRFNLMHDSGEVLLPGWPKKLNVVYDGQRDTRRSMFVTVDGTHSMTVYKSGKVEMSPELKEYLSMLPKVKSSDSIQDKKNRSNIKM